MELVTDWQSIAIILLGVGFSVLGWFARQIWESIDRLNSDIKKIEVSIPTSYTPKSEFQLTTQRIERELAGIVARHEAQRTQDMTEIRSMLERIYDKLEQKADK